MNTLLQLISLLNKWLNTIFLQPLRTFFNQNQLIILLYPLVGKKLNCASLI